MIENYFRKHITLHYFSHQFWLVFVSISSRLVETWPIPSLWDATKQSFLTTLRCSHAYLKAEALGLFLWLCKSAMPLLRPQLPSRGVGGIQLPFVFKINIFIHHLNAHIINSYVPAAVLLLIFSSPVCKWLTLLREVSLARTYETYASQGNEATILFCFKIQVSAWGFSQKDPQYVVQQILKAPDSALCCLQTPLSLLLLFWAWLLAADYSPFREPSPPARVSVAETGSSHDLIQQKWVQTEGLTSFTLLCYVLQATAHNLDIALGFQLLCAKKMQYSRMVYMCTQRLCTAVSISYVHAISNTTSQSEANSLPRLPDLISMITGSYCQSNLHKANLFCHLGSTKCIQQHVWRSKHQC